MGGNYGGNHPKQEFFKPKTLAHRTTSDQKGRARLDRTAIKSRILTDIINILLTIHFVYF